MKFEVLKPFTFAGSDLVKGDQVEIPDDSTKIGGLSRARFIRLANKETVQAVPAAPAAKDPKEIVRRAKAKAAKK